MSTNPTFVDDVFISYRHHDNERLDEEKKGWVDNFHEDFGIVLCEELGYEPHIWRDVRLPGNLDFPDVLKERIQKTATMVSILSPGYIQSEWCVGELKEFCRLAGGGGRLFKVVKTHVEPEEQPPEFRDLLGYEFYETDKTTNKRRAFGQGTGQNHDQRYWDKLYDLAVAVKQVLYAINPRVRKASGVSVFTPSQGVVYLAQTTGDLREQRDQIKRELQSRNYDVLPDKDLPYVSPDFQEAVRECVGRAKLSVHLIGGLYGAVPEGANGRSIIRLQNEIAADRSRADVFPRLLWLPVGLTPQEDAQAQFIENLRTDAAAQKGAELLQTPLEELKSVIQTRLTSNGHKPEPAPAGETPPKIYLIFDKRDLESVIPLNDYLAVEKNFEVLLPLIDDEGDDDAQALNLHNKNLNDCDAVLIYYGNGDQRWLEIKRGDLKKLAGTRKSPLEAVYVAPPKTGHKQLFNHPGAVVMKNFADFSPTALDSFLARIQTAKKGAGDAGN